MTEKRFEADKYYEVWDNDEFLLSFDQTVDLLNELNDENEQLKKKLEFFYELNKPYGTIIEENRRLKLKNEELRERNDRQAKQLDRLYSLIEEKDWRTLTDIMDDFKRCEEQLQREWGTYE